MQLRYRDRKYNREIQPFVHVTEELGTLISILKNGFRPSYCKEILQTPRGEVMAYFPMISFSSSSCDVVMRRMKSYGVYGVAMKTEWGLKNGLEPVNYFNKNSPFMAHLHNCFEMLKEQKLSEIEWDNIRTGATKRHTLMLIKSTVDLFSMSKNFYGWFERGGYQTETHPFGFEREWRKLIKEDDIPYFLTKEDENKKNNYHYSLSKASLKFQYTDIDRIIFSNVGDDERIKKEVPSMKKVEFSFIDEGYRYEWDEG